jgi:hypothetical protein
VLTGGWCLTLVTVAVLLLWRRLAGALTVPAHSAALLAVCLAAAVLSLLVGRMPLSRSQTWINGAGPLALAAVLTFPASGWPVCVMLWLVAAVPLAGVLSGTLTLPRISPASEGPPNENPASGRSSAVRQVPESGETALDCDVVQQLTRAVDAAGRDTLVGQVRVTFEPGARSQRAHVAFCPPFATVPTIALERNDPSGPQVRIGQVLTQGVRFDLKRRSGSDLGEEVEIRFQAAAPSV